MIPWKNDPPHRVRGQPHPQFSRTEFWLYRAWREGNREAQKRQPCHGEGASMGAQGEGGLLGQAQGRLRRWGAGGRGGGGGAAPTPGGGRWRRPLGVGG